MSSWLAQYLSSLERAPSPASYPAGTGALSFKHPWLVSARRGAPIQNRQRWRRHGPDALLLVPRPILERQPRRLRSEGPLSLALLPGPRSGWLRAMARTWRARAPAGHPLEPAWEIALTIRERSPIPLGSAVLPAPPRGFGRHGISLSPCASDLPARHLGPVRTWSAAGPSGLTGRHAQSTLGSSGVGSAQPPALGTGRCSATLAITIAIAPTSIQLGTCPSTTIPMIVAIADSSATSVA